MLPFGALINVGFKITFPFGVQLTQRMMVADIWSSLNEGTAKLINFIS